MNLCRDTRWYLLLRCMTFIDTPIKYEPQGITTYNCDAKLYQYAKNATFAPHFHTNFNKTWKKIYISIPIIT